MAIFIILSSLGVTDHVWPTRAKGSLLHPSWDFRGSAGAGKADQGPEQHSAARLKLPAVQKADVVHAPREPTATCLHSDVKSQRRV